jgi:hypothetical protein
MDPIALEDLALLEVLKRVDRGDELTATETEIRQRLYDSGLAMEGEGGLHLTTAGIELCKSLQHRVAADAQAEKILQKRDARTADT